MNKIFALLLSVVLLAMPASAQTWIGPDPDRRPALFGQGDVDFVLSELCLPFVVQDADAAEIVRQRRLPRGFGDRGWSGGEPFYLVGQADVHVAFATRAEQRACILRIGDGDVDRYLAAIEQRIATFPAPLTRFESPPSPNGAYGTQFYYCGPPEGPHYVILVSLGSDSRQAAVMVTVGRYPTRWSRCNTAPSPDPEQ